MNRSTRRRPRGGGDLAGAAVALLMFGRVIGPVLRTLSPVLRQPAVLVLLGLTIPVAIVMGVCRTRAEREMTEAMAARARLRVQRRPTGSDGAVAAGPAGDPDTSIKEDEAEAHDDSMFYSTSLPNPSA